MKFWHRMFFNHAAKVFWFFRLFGMNLGYKRIRLETSKEVSPDGWIWLYSRDPDNCINEEMEEIAYMRSKNIKQNLNKRWFRN